MSSQSADVAIVGAGIIGLAHAYIAARSGKKVVVFERNLAASGASVANFGMLWPIGQTAGPMFDLAIKSRELWLEVLQAAKLPLRNVGSLHIACRDDEAQVGQEFAALGPAHGYQCVWLDRKAALTRSTALNPDAVLGALWSETETTVDPRQVLRQLPEFLRERYGVRIECGCPVFAIEQNQVQTPRGAWRADAVIVCNGSDFEALYPDFFARSGLTRCRLQMLRTSVQPDGWELGPALAGGLTFRFYPSFRICPSLPNLRKRIADEMPEYDRFGIHTMVSQTSSGELTLGDSHDYGLLPSPFNREEIDTLILRHLASFIAVPDFSIAERWYGVYAKHLEKPYIRFKPEESVEVVTGLGGAGMTLSFGVATETFELWQAAEYCQ
ncbi:MAG TPA: TIGR03364 family FAD-dependent oxidoreductase [Acidobacteriaceae bacterium]